MEESGVGYRTSTLLAFLLFLALLLLVVAVDGQTPKGFISIDCGQENSYNDSTTGLSYVSDSDFIDTGENHKIPSDITSLRDQQGNHLRSFPNGTRNCYRLPVKKHKKYLIRASFYYGNYDGLNQTPQFDLYLDATLWKSIINMGATDYYFTEILAFASRDWMFVCLVNRGSGIPFISSLESRQLDDDMYPLVMSNQLSVLFQRLNIQPLIEDEIVRYPNDIYDRIWMPYSSDSLETLSTSKKINTCTRCKYPVPLDVLQTCGVPAENGSTINITFQWPQVDNNIESKKVLALHVAEIQNLTTDQSRIYVGFSNLRNVQENGPHNYPSYLHKKRYIFGPRLLTSDDFIYFALGKADNSTLPPILSAIEVYEVKELTDSISTKEEEVDAMMEIKTSYKLKNWQGDPCAPNDYVWEGIKCNEDYNSSIIRLNLTSSGLSGRISKSFRNFQQLQYLDLSNNNLSGKIPHFLKDLKELKVLNLSNNNLNGLIPSGLQEKSSDGILTMRHEGNPDLCINTDKCGNNSSNRIVIIIPIVVTSLIIVLVVIMIIIWRRKKRPSGAGDITLGKMEAGNSSLHTIDTDNKKLAYNELISMTSDFSKKIGRGGFGPVFHGIMNNGIPVAVKLLDISSSQGPREFQTEAQLLTRIHHKNLVSLVGYCNERDHLALVYQYMAGGNLKDRLSSSTTDLKFKDRLRIATEVAEGLDYLHRMCKPSIVHRDIKTSNILLSEESEALISDFGLSKIFINDAITHMSTMVVGTPGYLDPEYHITSQLKEKSDVYSFGIVLLELITGKSAVIKKGEDDYVSLVDWVESILERGDIAEIVDPKLNGEYNTKSALKAIEIASACTSSVSIQRSTMQEVVMMLKECFEI